MLYDNLENLNQYTGLFNNLDTVIEYIEQNNLDELPMGKTQIDGDNIFVIISEAATTQTQELNFETHSKYMDLQIDLTGTELFEIALGAVQEIVPYDEQKDFALFKGDTSSAGILGEGRFVVFMIEEPHKPCIKAEGCDKVKKCVFKIAR